MSQLKIFKKIGKTKLGRGIIKGGATIATGVTLITVGTACNPEDVPVQIIVEDPNPVTNPGEVEVTNPDQTTPTTQDPVDNPESTVVDPEVVEPVEDEKKYDYTAEGITNLYIDIFNNNGYFERDEAWALVIAANMDNIAEEDFNKLLEEHNFTIESLGESYYNCIDKLNSIKVNKIHSASYGGDLYYGIDENLLKLYNNKSIKLDNLFIDKKYKQYCVELIDNGFYNLTYEYAKGDLGKYLEGISIDNCNNSDATLYNIDLASFGTDSLSEEIINPYDLILEKEFTR